MTVPHTDQPKVNFVARDVASGIKSLMMYRIWVAT